MKVWAPVARPALFFCVTMRRMGSKTPILCVTGITLKRGPHALCTFTLTWQKYGSLTGVQAICTLHGREVNIQTTISNWTSPKK